MTDAVGITPGLIRISAGLEDVSDIIKDIDQAMASSSIYGQSVNGYFTVFNCKTE